MQWLYYCDFFFWYLQKVSLLLILIWLGRSWWQESGEAWWLKRRKTK
ncbi:MAG TPA: hypothetical protein VIL83_07115 [Capillibacterium sp.]